MIIYEEDWTADGDALDREGGSRLGFLDSGGDYDERAARARLAAQAPAMARMLLEHQWVSQEGDRGYLAPACPQCEEYQSNGHRSDCALVAVLRAAGVIDPSRNHILCPECFAKTPCEEKCCSHGVSPGIVCLGCGKVRTSQDPGWVCGGTTSARSTARSVSISPPEKGPAPR